MKAGDRAEVQWRYCDGYAHRTSTITGTIAAVVRSWGRTVVTVDRDTRPAGMPAQVTCRLENDRLVAE